MSADVLPSQSESPEAALTAALTASATPVGKRIHLVCQGADRSGGAEIYTRRLVSELTGRGYDATLICFRADADVEEHCRIERITRHRGWSTPGCWRFGSLGRPTHYRRELRSLPLNSPDVAIVGDALLAKAYRSAFPHVPLVYVPHSLVAPIEIRSYGYQSRWQERTEAWLYERHERWLLNEAAATIRFTETACDTMRSHYGDRIQPRFRVFPPATDLPSLRPKPAGRSTVGLLFVGRLVESKNVAFSLRSLAQNLASDWRFDVVGDGPERTTLESLAKELGVEDRVAFHGHVQDVNRYYQDADLLVFPSKLEYAPLAVLEAMANGLSTLTIRGDQRRYRNANHEIVTDGVDGFLAADEADFRDQLSRLLDSPERLEAAGAAARQTAVARHSWERHMVGYDTAFREVLG